MGWCCRRRLCVSERRKSYGSGAYSGACPPCQPWREALTYHACPLCGSVWSDYQRKENILATVRAAVETGDPWCGWEATTETSGGVVGFTELNELYVCIPGTSIRYNEILHQVALQSNHHVG